MDESVYMINLKDSFEKPRTKRAKYAMKIIRAFITRHSKTPLENVRLSNHLNGLVWARGIQKPPRRVKVKMVRMNGKSYVYHIDEKITQIKEEKPKDAKETKEPAKEGEKKDEAKKAPATKNPIVKKEKDKDRKAAAINKPEIG